jgi:hypothetical protein
MLSGCCFGNQLGNQSLAIFFMQVRKQIFWLYSSSLVVFRLSHRISNPRYQSVVLVAFWSVLTVWLTTFICLRNCAILATVVTLSTRLLKHEIVAWILCVAFVCNCGSSWLVYQLSEPATYYREYQLYIYLAVKVLNFNIHLRRNPATKIDTDALLLFVEYMLYPPYAALLIVLFEDYCAQRRSIKETPPQSWSWMGLRLAFWFCFVELSLHFTRVNAFFNAPFTMITNLHNYESKSIF